MRMLGIPVAEVHHIGRVSPERYMRLMKSGSGVSGAGALMIEESKYREIMGMCKLRGIGDLVALAAKSVARVGDAILKTSLSNCRGCEERQRKLNNLIPFN